MQYPSFFDEIEDIELIDPLGDFLGAFEGGLVEISYTDCVKLAGHSCPTVASAFLMSKYALQELYSDELPKRSQIKVEMSAAKDQGVTGVIANVIAYIVGAGDEGGFKGIGRSFSRNHLLSFGSNDTHSIRFTRVDNRESVLLDCDTSLINTSSQMKPLMQKILEDKADYDEKIKFQELWQNRVKQMLTDKKLQDKMITITKE